MRTFLHPLQNPLAFEQIDKLGLFGGSLAEIESWIEFNCALRADVRGKYPLLPSAKKLTDEKW